MSTELDEWVARVVATAPPIPAESREQIAHLLGPSRPTPARAAA